MEFYCGLTRMPRPHWGRGGALYFPLTHAINIHTRPHSGRGIHVIHTDAHARAEGSALTRTCTHRHTSPQHCATNTTTLTHAAATGAAQAAPTPMPLRRNTAPRTPPQLTKVAATGAARAAPTPMPLRRNTAPRTPPPLPMSLPPVRHGQHPHPCHYGATLRHAHTHFSVSMGGFASQVLPLQRHGNSGPYVCWMGAVWLLLFHTHSEGSMLRVWQTLTEVRA